MSDRANSPGPRPAESYTEMIARLVEEILPKVQEERHAKAIRRERRRLALNQIALQAIANTLGTVIGGGILILLAHFIGLLGDISMPALAAIGLMVLVAGVILILLARQRPQTPEEEAAAMAARLTALQVKVDVITRQAASP